MLDFDVILNLYRIALANVHYETVDFFVEKCYRHYSKTYHTPLSQAKKELNPAEVILIFFEDTLAHLPPEERWKAVYKNFAYKQPVVPEMTASELNIIDEEGEEEFLLQNLITQLSKETSNSELKKEDQVKSPTVQSADNKNNDESDIAATKDKMLEELFNDPELAGITPLTQGETKFDLDE